MDTEGKSKTPQERINESFFICRKDGVEEQNHFIKHLGSNISQKRAFLQNVMNVSLTLIAATIGSNVVFEEKVELATSAGKVVFACGFLGIVFLLLNTLLTILYLFLLLNGENKRLTSKKETVVEIYGKVLDRHLAYLPKALRDENIESLFEENARDFDTQKTLFAKTESEIYIPSERWEILILSSFAGGLFLDFIFLLEKVI